MSNALKSRLVLASTAIGVTAYAVVAFAAPLTRGN